MNIVECVKKVSDNALAWFVLTAAGIAGIGDITRPKSIHQADASMGVKYWVYEDGITFLNVYGNTRLKIDILPLENTAFMSYERKERLDLKIVRFCLTDFNRDGIVDIIRKDGCEFVRSRAEKKEDALKIFRNADKCWKDYIMEFNSIIKKAEKEWNTRSKSMR